MESHKHFYLQSAESNANWIKIKVSKSIPELSFEVPGFLVRIVCNVARLKKSLRPLRPTLKFMIGLQEVFNEIFNTCKKGYSLLLRDAGGHLEEVESWCKYFTEVAVWLNANMRFTGQSQDVGKNFDSCFLQIWTSTWLVIGHFDSLAGLQLMLFLSRVSHLGLKYPVVALSVENGVSRRRR